MKRTQTGGFTLLELMVVMAVIAILTAGVLAGLGGVRRSMNNAKATAQTKRLANAFVAYYNKYGYWPPGLTPDTPRQMDWVYLSCLVTNRLGLFELERKATNSTGQLIDPWKNIVQVQVSGAGINGTVTDPFGGGGRLSVSVAVWSAGPDNQYTPGAGYSGVNTDNPRNW